jgi:hypothetical protein
MCLVIPVIYAILRESQTKSQLSVISHKQISFDFFRFHRPRSQIRPRAGIWVSSGHLPIGSSLVFNLVHPLDPLHDHRLLRRPFILQLPPSLLVLQPTPQPSIQDHYRHVLPFRRLLSLRRPARWPFVTIFDMSSLIRESGLLEYPSWSAIHRDDLVLTISKDDTSQSATGARIRTEVIWWMAPIAAFVLAAVFASTRECWIAGQDFCITAKKRTIGLFTPKQKFDLPIQYVRLFQFRSLLSRSLSPSSRSSLI